MLFVLCNHFYILPWFSECGFSWCYLSFILGKPLKLKFPFLASVELSQANCPPCPSPPWVLRSPTWAELNEVTPCTCIQLNLHILPFLYIATFLYFSLHLFFASRDFLFARNSGSLSLTSVLSFCCLLFVYWALPTLSTWSKWWPFGPGG